MIMGSVQARTTGGAGKAHKGEVGADAVRSLIAQYLQLDVGRVSDAAHLSDDLGADWLDRLELCIRLEDLTGVEITHDEADRFECVGDLIHYIGEKQRYSAEGYRQGYRGGEFRRASI
jgi:acyl carrier protein